MRVVFLEDVTGVAQGGDVKDVKNGFARNYLIPQSLAVPVSSNAMQRVAKLRDSADKKRVKLLGDMKALGETLNGLRLDIEMNSGASGRLYGSVTNMLIAEKLTAMTNNEIDRRTVEIVEPIRKIGKFNVGLRLHSEVQSNITVLVYPTGSDPNETLASIEAEALAAAKEEDASEDESNVAALDEVQTDMPEKENVNMDDSGESQNSDQLNTRDNEDVEEALDQEPVPKEDARDQ